MIPLKDTVTNGNQQDLTERETLMVCPFNKILQFVKTF